VTAAPLAPRSAAEQARLDAALVEMFERHITFNAVLGLKVLSVRPGDVRGRITMRPDLVGHFTFGRLHGGVISATLDAMGGLALMVAIAERHPHDDTQQVLHRFSRMGTIDLRIDYLRPATGPRFQASAQVLRLGGRVASTRMEFSDAQGKLLCTGAAAYIVA